MNIILAGIMGRYPYGGVAWCSLMYLLGLQRLGHRVWYLEDTGQSNFDPTRNSLATRPAYALSFIDSCMRPYSLEERWCYIDWRGKYYGHTREAWQSVCAGADLFLNLSGGCWFWRDEYASIPHSAFIDSDPVFTQRDITRRGTTAEAFFSRYGALFTFGSNIGASASSVDSGPFKWEHTWQPVASDEWGPIAEPPRPCFTTVMSWKVRKLRELGGNKDREFLKLIDLPSMTRVPLELAVSGPQEMLQQHGWRCRDAFSVSHDLDSYRDYVRTSMGEFSVAKSAYVQADSGWFSDRTECYLTSGRPAVVQDTGFSAHLPVGEGLFAFQSAEEAAAGIETIAADYARHSRCARELALEHFASEVVLPPLLERATSGAGS